MTRVFSLGVALAAFGLLAGISSVVASLPAIAACTSGCG
jgi:hypothetical protein